MCVSSQCTARSLPRLEKNVFYPALSGMIGPVFSANPALAAALNETLELDTSLAYMYFLKFRIGMCVPSTCSLQDMRSLAGYFGKQMKSNVTVPWCEIKEKPVLPGYYVAVLSIFGVGILINIMGTLLQVGPKILRVIRRMPQPIKEPQKNIPRQLLEAFSVYANSQKVLSTKTNDRSMRCLHGIRFVSMLWVMLGHVYFSRNNSQVLGAIRAKGLGKDFAFQVVLNASLSVDTFFLLSGLLLMFVCYGKLKKDNGRFDFLMYYVHRYIRLTPPFLMVSLLLILGPPWMNGPIWHETVDRFAEGCKRYWWTNLIYISSWMKNDEVCLPHGWYLSCDMQYFIIAPIFFVALYRKPALGFGLIGAAALVSMALTGLVTYIFDFGPVALFSIPDDDNLNSFLNNIAFRPYTHFPSFAVGLLLGYIIYKYREIKISRKMQLAGWLSAVTTGLTILYGVYDWNAYSPPGPFLSILYGSTSRPAWSLCVAWVTFACVSGHGGFVNTLLSWKAFVPLSKLTFMAYLLHPPLMFMYAAHTINAIYVTQFMMVYLYFAHLLACYMASFVACVTCESPFINVERILFGALNEFRRNRAARRITSPPADGCYDHRTKSSDVLEDDGKEGTGSFSETSRRSCMVALPTVDMSDHNTSSSSKL
ncbi:nose resistant to fluoxetine protein 6 [Ixodes scapularis]